MKRVFLLLFFILSLPWSGSTFGQELRITSIPFKLHWENTPKDFLLESNTLTLVAQEKTDMFRDPNVTYNTDNAPKLLFTPDEDFVLAVSIQHAFKEKWDGGAIVLKMDSLNWVKFCFEKDYLGAKRVVSVVTKNFSDDCNSVSFQNDKAFFKLAKAGQVVTLYCSEDGANWLLVRHLHLDNYKSLSVGFLAQSPMGATCSVKFSDITYQRKRITDPYSGN
jgi:uncharacterized protein